MFNAQLLKIIEFCAGECKRQESGELSVFWMVNAYAWALNRWQNDTRVTEQDILALAALIEPEKNANGYRKVPVRLGGNVIGWQHIERRIEILVEFQDQFDAAGLYKEFEEIHPLLDGNGRLGAILYNLKNGTLDNPVIPPKVQFRVQI